MSMLDDPLAGQIERYLDLSAKRQQLIVSNMANADTPSYRTHDIDFDGELRNAAEATGSNPQQPKVVDVPGLLERPDGNNVNIDREALLLAKTQLQFRMGTQLLKHEFQRLATVIKEGS